MSVMQGEEMKNTLGNRTSSECLELVEHWHDHCWGCPRIICDNSWNEIEKCIKNYFRRKTWK